MSVKYEHITCMEHWRSCFCDTAPSLNTIRRGFVALIRAAFSDVTRLDSDGFLNCLHYDKEASKRTINISAKGTQNPSDTEHVPGITVSLGDGVNFGLNVINDTMVTSDDTARLTSMTQGTVNITIKCSDYDPDVSCAMADACMLFIMGTKPRVMEVWGWISDYRVVKQTEPIRSQLSGEDTSTPWYDSTLVIQLTYDYAVDIELESKRLKDYSSEITIKGT